MMHHARAAPAPRHADPDAGARTDSEKRDEGCGCSPAVWTMMIEWGGRPWAGPHSAKPVRRRGDMSAPCAALMETIMDAQSHALFWCACGCTCAGGCRAVTRRRGVYSRGQVQGSDPSRREVDGGERPLRFPSAAVMALTRDPRPRRRGPQPCWQPRLSVPRPLRPFRARRRLRGPSG